MIPRAFQKSMAEEFGFRGDRVRRHTTQRLNREITQEMQAAVQTHNSRDPAQIDRRIRELEREWDIERVLEMNASLAALGGLLLGLTIHRRWLWLPAVVLPFLFQHAVQGWCPPVPLLRRLGVRTQREIEAEKYALKSLQRKSFLALARNNGNPPPISLRVCPGCPDLQ